MYKKSLHFISDSEFTVFEKQIITMSIFLAIILIAFSTIILCYKCSNVKNVSIEKLNEKSFYVLSELGSGTFAIVYKVKDKNTKIKSAIKQINLKGNLT